MVTEKDLKWYKQLVGSGINLFNTNIIFEIMSNGDVDQITDEKLLDVANIVRECYLKDDDNFPLHEIVEAVLLNYADIIENDMSPRQILAKFI